MVYLFLNLKRGTTAINVGDIYSDSGEGEESVSTTVSGRKIT